METSEVNLCVELASIACIKAASVSNTTDHEMRGEEDNLIVMLSSGGDSTVQGLCVLGEYFKEISDAEISSIIKMLQEQGNGRLNQIGRNALFWLRDRYQTTIRCTRHLNMVRRELRLTYGCIAIWEAANRYLLSYRVPFGAYLNYYLKRVNWKAGSQRQVLVGIEDDQQEFIGGMVRADPEEYLRRLWGQHEDPLAAHQMWLKRIREG